MKLAMRHEPNGYGDGIKIRKNALNTQRALRDLFGHYANAEPMFNPDFSRGVLRRCI